MIKHLTPRNKKEVNAFLKTLTATDKIRIGTTSESEQLVKEGIEEGVEDELEFEILITCSLATALLTHNLNMSKLLLNTHAIKNKRLIDSVTRCIQLMEKS